MLIFCMSPAFVEAQPRTPRQPRAVPIKGLVVTFHGVVKKLTKKEILLESDDKQLLTLRCSRKTTFSGADGAVKPSDIDLESRVSIDAREDADLKLVAIHVQVDEPRKKTFK